MRILLLVIAVTAASCHAGSSAPTDDVVLIADATPDDNPSLSHRIEFEPRRPELGYGSFDFAAHPEEDEIRVSLIVGERAGTTRWLSCARVELQIEGDRSTVTSSYMGVPMEGGVFDALSLDLTLDHVRAMSMAARASVRVCGDEVPVPPRELRQLARFVRQFEKMATYDGPPPPPPPPSGSVHEKPRTLRRASSPYPA